MIAYLGSFVAIFAASMALVNNDLKKNNSLLNPIAIRLYVCGCWCWCI